MKVLVTGGAGYIGSHACKALARAGYSPIAYDSLEFGHEWAVKWGPLVRGELADTAKLIKTIKESAIEAVMHFAAYTSVGESVKNPGRYHANNVGGSLSLLEAMAATGVNRIVFSSTAATYGTPVQVPISEEHPQNPINPYGASKLFVERMLADFGVSHGIRSTALRYFNASGADPECEIGEVHDPETHLIPLAIDAALDRRAPLTVFGTDYPTEDGTCIRDYIHVTDLADAHVLALETMKDAAPGLRAYNLGNGKGFSVREVINAIERVGGKPVPHSFGARREGDPSILVADAAKARRELGWTPRLNDLDTIVRTAYDWATAYKR